MNRAVILAGSNFNEQDNLKKSLQKLQNHGSLIKHSPAIYTVATGAQYQKDFLDQALVVETNLSQTEFTEALKAIEQVLGRTPALKQQGLIPIDLDLLVWNGVMLKRDFLETPSLRALVQEVELFDNL
jgi:2-amino-4-hydroxy-6-hydroxymethyldihydropteridine diphosphokinase